VTSAGLVRLAKPRGEAGHFCGSGAGRGSSLGGDSGTLIGLIGFGIDNLLSAEVALAHGQVVTADPHQESDLLWALRGGGGNFGVVTELRTRLHPFATVMTE
jgi:FAD/FMN-containing dehydrogenase